jgi:hypothetical protein
MSSVDWLMTRAYKTHAPGLESRNVRGWSLRYYACQAQIISNRFESHMEKVGLKSFKIKIKHPEVLQGGTISITTGRRDNC